jgi:hypothetical protein
MTSLIPDAETRLNRRQAFKIGGLTVSFAAIVAACGEDRGGATTGGRVGYAPPVTQPPDYAVDDVVLLRTASSLEYTAIYVYEQALALGVLDADTTALVEELVRNHQDVADTMGELTEDAGGVAWECTNPWMMDRLIEPLLALIVDSDNPARDVFNTAVGLENLAASTHQSLSVSLTEPAAKSATLSAAVLESRHSAALVVRVRGAEGYISPGIDGEGVPNDADGIPPRFAVTGRFGSVAQAELIVGAPDENGARESFLLQTPAENSFVYSELEPTC